jgi:hypothetical protein
MRRGSTYQHFFLEIMTLQALAPWNAVGSTWDGPSLPTMFHTVLYLGISNKESHLPSTPVQPKHVSFPMAQNEALNVEWECFNPSNKCLLPKIPSRRSIFACWVLRQVIQTSYRTIFQSVFWQQGVSGKCESLRLVRLVKFNCQCCWNIACVRFFSLSSNLSFQWLEHPTRSSAYIVHPVSAARTGA